MKPCTIILCILGFLLLDYAGFVYAWETATYPPWEAKVHETRLNGKYSEVIWIDDPIYGRYVAVNHDTGWTQNVNVTILTTNQELLRNTTYEIIPESKTVNTMPSYIYWIGKSDVLRRQP